jgi:GTP-binding protein Era
MTEKKITKCGTVSIVGRPNTGKSTLLNNIIGEKVAIVSPVPQTTRSQIRGIFTDERGQIIFIDTPGWHLGKDRLDSYMNASAAAAMEGMDCLVYLVDLVRRIGPEEEGVAQQVKEAKCPVILGLNKIDASQDRIPEYISFWEKVKGCSVQEMKDFTMIPLSGDKGTNVEKLVQIIFDMLPEGPLLYPEDTISDTPQKLAIADIVREKLFNLTRDEIPHALGVAIERMVKVKGNTWHINALIIVEKTSQKEIVIGKGGKMLKDVGTRARIELEQLLEKKVFLELYVRVEKNWRDKVTYLQELGYDWNQKG